MKRTLQIPNSFYSVLMSSVRRYFQSEEHEQEFRDWYKAKYGKEYESEVSLSGKQQKQD